MEKPKSILNFEKFYIAGFLIGLVSLIFNFSTSMRMIQQSGGPMAASAFEFLIFGTAVGALIVLLFWYFIAVRASKAAKWILTVFFVLGLISTLSSASSVSNSILIFTLLTNLAQGIAISFLFRPDAIAWFNGDPTDVGDVFD